MLLGLLALAMCFRAKRPGSGSFLASAEPGVQPVRSWLHENLDLKTVISGISVAVVLFSLHASTTSRLAVAEDEIRNSATSRSAGAADRDALHKQLDQIKADTASQYRELDRHLINDYKPRIEINGEQHLHDLLDADRDRRLDHLEHALESRTRR